MDFERRNRTDSENPEELPKKKESFEPIDTEKVLQELDSILFSQFSCYEQAEKLLPYFQDPRFDEAVQTFLTDEDFEAGRTPSLMRTLLDHAKNIPERWHQQIFNPLIELPRGLDFYLTALFNPNLKLDQDAIWDKIFSDSGNFTRVFQHIDQIPEKYHERIVGSLLNEEVGVSFSMLASKANKLSKNLQEKIFQKLFTPHDVYLLLRHKENFPQLDADKVLALLRPEGEAERVEGKGYYPHVILKFFENFPKAKRAVLLKEALQSLGMKEVIFILKDKELSSDEQEVLMPGMIDYNFSKAVTWNSSAKSPFFPELKKFSDIAGIFSSRELYQYYQEQNENEDILRQKIETVRKGIIESDPKSLEDILFTPMLREAAINFTRFDISEWSFQEESDFAELISRYLRHYSEYAPLPEEYEIGTLETFKQRQRKKEVQAYTPEFTHRFEDLLVAIREAGMLAVNAEPGKMKRHLYRKFLTALKTEYQKAEQVVRSAPNKPAKKFAEKRITELESIDLRSEDAMADTFSKLYNRKKSPELAEIFRLYAFSKVMEDRNDPQYFPAMDSIEPSASDISKVLNFVHHIAHQEYWGKKEAFTDKKVQAGLDSLFHVKALEEQLQKMNSEANERKGRPVSLQIIPSRGILTELSGQLGDACWASQYEILDEFPNVSSLTFIQENEVAGSCLLIDTQTETGENVTIIRGLNPLESIINNLNIESFVEGVKKYVTEVAKKRGRRGAIVIDDHSGGSATNRPLLFAYLSGLKNSLT